MLSLIRPCNQWPDLLNEHSRDMAPNGFGALWNWNRFGDGIHTAVAYADGEEFDRTNFTVTTFGKEFLSGKTGTWSINDFPSDGDVTYIQWDQSEQNFVITGVE